MGSRLAPAFALAAALALTVPSPPARAETRAEIRAVLEAQSAAWNRGDLEGFMAGYWRHDSLSFYSGGHITRGWDTVRERYARRYQAGGASMGALRFDLHSIEPLARDAAVVKGAWHLARNDTTRGGLLTLILRRVKGSGWVVVHDHTSLAD